MRKLVLISLDAFYCDDVQALPPDSFLAQCLQQSAVCTHVRPVFPALTYPAHCTLMTGCDPAQHQVGHNQPFQPGVKQEMRRWYWQLDDIRRETLISAVHRQGGRVASILWPVTGKTRHIRWNFPEVLALPGESQTMKMLRYGTAGWILRMELKHGRKRVSSQQPHLSDYASILAQDVIASHQPELTCVHFVDLDEMRHRYGVHSPQAQEAVLRLDRRVRDIWQTMQRTPGMEDAILAVVSDHGQADIDRTVVLAEHLHKAGLADSTGVQSCGMTAYFHIPSAADATAVQAWAEQHLAEIGASRIYTRQQLDDLGAAPGIAFAVEAAPGVVFADHLDGYKREKATHGYGPDHPTGNCLLAVRGPGLHPGECWNTMPMRDVAPTLAALMGIDLPQAVGCDRSAAALKG